MNDQEIIVDNFAGGGGIRRNTMKNDYIRRSEAISLLHYNTDEACSAVVADFEALPAADVRPAVRSWWEEHETSSFAGYDKNGEEIWHKRKFYRCMNCRRGSAIKEKFCPSCGADMRGGSQ